MAQLEFEYMQTTSIATRGGAWHPVRRKLVKNMMSRKQFSALLSMTMWLSLRWRSTASPSKMFKASFKPGGCLLSSASSLAVGLTPSPPCDNGHVSGSSPVQALYHSMHLTHPMQIQVPTFTLSLSKQTFPKHRLSQTPRYICARAPWATTSHLPLRVKINLKGMEALPPPQACNRTCI